MGIGGIQTLQALLDYEDLAKGCKGKVIIRRSYLSVEADKEPVECLEAVLVKDLTLWQKVKLFFGVSDYSLHTVAKLARRAGDAFADFKPSSSEIKTFQQAVSDINKKITKRNERSPLLPLFNRILVPSLRIPILSPVPAFLFASKGPSPKQLVSEAVPVPPKDTIPLPKPTSSPKTTRGIVNPGCLCYANASIKGLLFSSGFRKMLTEQDTYQAKLLLDILTELEKPGDALSHDGDLLGSFDIEIATLFPNIASRYIQQDAAEFTKSMLELVLKEVSVAQSGPVRGSLKSVGFIPVKRVITRLEATEPEVLKNVTIAAMDTPPTIELSQYIQIMDPGSKASLQAFFSGVVYDHEAELTDVLNAEKNSGLSAEKRDALIQSMNQKGLLPVLQVVEKTIFAPLPDTAWVPPPFLPIQLARYRNTVQRNSSGKICGYVSDKVRAKVAAPLHLSVPVEGREAERYTLRSVVVHDGLTTGSGHYVTYIPDPTASLDAEGNPMRWFMQSDSSAPQSCSWEEAKNDILTQGYLFFYDHDSVLPTPP